MTRRAARPLARATTALAVLAAPAACADPLGFGVGGGPDLAISLDRSPPATPSDAPLTLDVDGNGVRVRLVERRSQPYRAEAQVRGDRYGDRTMRVTLRSAAGDSVAGVTFEQHFGRDSDHWVGAVIGTRRPFGICLGALNAVRVAGRADSLFVFYGSLPKDAIC